MKAVILAAGRGQRLGEYTKEVPKTLIDICGFPILAHTLNSIVKEGIRDAVIITGYRADKIKEFVSKSDIGINVKFVHNERFSETNNIYSIYLARDHVEGDGFVLINSDVLFHPEILSALLKSNKRGVILSIDFRKELGEEEMKVIVEGNKIVRISKQIPPKDADGEYIGLTRIDAEYSKDFFDAVKETLKDEGENVFYESAFQRMIDEEKNPTFESTNGLPWIEIDTEEDLRIAREVIAPQIQIC
jgi:choline kinase